MKNKILLIILCLLLLPVLVNAKTCDTSKVTIKSVDISTHQGDVEELEEVTFKDKTLGVNLKFNEVDDYIEYKIVIKNDAEEDFEVDKTSLKLDLDYLEYSLTPEDDSKIIKSGEEKTILLRITYANPVDPEKFVNGKYIEEKNIQLNLTNNDETTPTIVNPKTTTKLIILGIILLLLVIGTIIVLKGSTTAKLLSILVVLGLIPITTSALCKCNINVDSHIEIEQVNKFCVFVRERSNEDVIVKYYEYETNDTIADVLRKNDSLYSELALNRDYEYGNQNGCSLNILINVTREKLDTLNLGRLYDAEGVEFLNGSSKVTSYTNGCYIGQTTLTCS